MPNFEGNKNYALFHDCHRKVPEGIELLFRDTLEFSLKYLSVPSVSPLLPGVFVEFYSVCRRSTDIVIVMTLHVK